MKQILETLIFHFFLNYGIYLQRYFSLILATH